MNLPVPMPSVSRSTRLHKTVATIEYLHAVRGAVDIEDWGEALKLTA